ncbi:putative calnexin protein [Clavispora lusitaniae]|uniref:Calnexin protein n=1 Tax=Clavispora lusitaniae TaxID=36911 RepID=A0ACD0WSE9_CLALS|nr:putative calnexin protein [Clavispora lusitaniae]QFZ35732.1 putative calnexin protein [Clavispora lusitaniae]QFZ41414.1 putative calnexin protein [Clavispora lusitaniae]QFZ47092.1 putative calnexin protein [Clavispora lusitaniae]QFZ52769.1 putative calnexin protein [Clavispora lusitaniae]
MKLSALAKIAVFLHGVYGIAFEPYNVSSLSKSSFFEQFDYDSVQSSHWVPSRGEKSDGSRYLGEWAVEEPTVYPGFAGDRALVMKSEAAYYAISRRLDTPLKTAKSDVVLQFEVKFQDGITCGGAYVKLVTDASDQDHFSDRTPFEIMFGPDLCGSSNRVLFIVKTQVGSEVVESRIRTPPMARENRLSNLYTLVLRKNYDVEIRINGDVAKASNLFTPHFMVPPLSEPEYIEDAEATKPDDWDDRRFVEDETAHKPDNWDSDHGAMWIPNPDIEKPAGWNDDETQPEYIRDPEAEKPQDWDETEDGEWKAPLIRNPLCLYGCGHWEAPKIVNPNYKGAWVPPQIPNPNYQGEWIPPKMKNPAYTGKNEIDFSPVEALGIEVWSMQAGVSFDNIYLGHSVKEAQKIGNATFVPKSEAEYADYEKNKPKPKHEPAKPPRSFEDMLEDESVSQFSQFVEFLRLLVWTRYMSVKDFWAMFEADPVYTISSHPFKFAFYCAVFLIVFTFVFGAINIVAFMVLKKDTPAAPEKKEKEAEKEKIKELSEEEVLEIIRGTGASRGQTAPRRRN